MQPLIWNRTIKCDKTDAGTQKATVNKPKRRPLPDHLHTIRNEHNLHQPNSGLPVIIGEDVSEKLHQKHFYKEQHC